MRSANGLGFPLECKWPAFAFSWITKRFSRFSLELLGWDRLFVGEHSSPLRNHQWQRRNQISHALSRDCRRHSSRCNQPGTSLLFLVHMHAGFLGSSSPTFDSHLCLQVKPRCFFCDTMHLYRDHDNRLIPEEQPIFPWAGCNFMTIMLNALVNASNQREPFGRMVHKHRDRCAYCSRVLRVYHNPLITYILLKEASVSHFMLVQLITWFNFSSEYTTVLSKPSSNYNCTVARGKWLN